MSIRHILCLSAASTIPQLAPAALPPSPALGQVEGARDFCGQVDRQSAAKYANFKKSLVQGVPEKGGRSGGSKASGLQRGL